MSDPELRRKRLSPAHDVSALDSGNQIIDSCLKRPALSAQASIQPLDESRLYLRMKDVKASAERKRDVLDKLGDQ